MSKIFSPISVAWGYYTIFWIFTFTLGCITGCRCPRPKEKALRRSSFHAHSVIFAMGFQIKNTRYMQYVAALAATISISAGSMYISWSSPADKSLQPGESSLEDPIVGEELSWLKSIYLLAGLPISPLVAYLLDKIGRKWTLMLGGFFLFFPWFIIIFATKSWMVFLGRFLGGCGYGFVVNGCSIYNGEIADSDIRGKLGTSFNLMKLVGNMLVLGAGPFISYQALGAICAVVPVIFMVVFYFMPESPFYLVRCGKMEEAKSVLCRLSPQNMEDAEIEKKLLKISDIVKSDMENKMSFKEFITKKEYRKIIFIIFGVKTLQQMAGNAAIEGYMQHIIESTGSSISSEMSSIIFGAVQFPATILSSLVVDKMGRKPMLLISALICALALIGEGVYFFLQNYLMEDVTALSWLPTTGIVLFLVSSTFGVLNLPYVLLGELFPTNIKGIAVTTATFYGFLLAFIVTKIFEPIKQAWGFYTIFWIFAGFCIAGALFVLFFLPETKGKNFDEIQAKINYGKHWRDHMTSKNETETKKDNETNTKQEEKY
ncbi:PREDICTED: facilitated trehalose transporter Tret1-like [Nicrophorus vespilloides]|uniref:Facilitated trehalose transporter Tret1-like n=1 Tax=Nicrophorus vespilloides TaxID=110193 RepID=A0ABM1N748_NICVS|nr:PREDICTED: facilitated trehalose transporter Tret1-like [Nicrophorus vespilloides]